MEIGNYNNNVQNDNIFGGNFSNQKNDKIVNNNSNNKKNSFSNKNMLFQKLQNYAKKNENKEYDIELESEKEFIKIREKRRIGDIFRHRSFEIIPKFFHSKKKERNYVQVLYDQTTKMEVRRENNRILISDDELDQIWKFLMVHAVGDKIDYENFSKILYSKKFNHMIQKLSPYFKASVFLKFYRDFEGKISIEDFFQFLLKKLSLVENKIELSKYDKDCNGYLLKSQLKKFLRDSILKLGIFKTGKFKREKYRKLYIDTCCQKFIFFLGRSNGSELKLYLEDLISSSILQEFNEIIYSDSEDQIYNEKGTDSVDNWFSLDSVLSVRETFEKLDFTNSLYLTKNEFLAFNNNSLTPIFATRLFQVYFNTPPTPDNENQKEIFLDNINNKKKNHIDFNMFLNFLLAFEYKEHPQSIRYFFKILDIDGKGYLTPRVIRIFLHDIMKKMKNFFEEEITVHTILKEIYEIVVPENGKDIYLKDFLKEPILGSKVLFYLIDIESYNADEKTVDDEDDDA